MNEFLHHVADRAEALAGAPLRSGFIGIRRARNAANTDQRELESKGHHDERSIVHGAMSCRTAMVVEEFGQSRTGK